MRALLIGVAAVAAAVIVAVAPLELAAAAAAPPLNPARLVLSLTDLPTGFSVAPRETGPRSNKQAANAKTPAAQLAAWGRTSGYQASFTRDASLSSLLAGALVVTSEASVYRDGVGAARSYLARARICRPPAFRRLSVGARIGEEATLCRATVKHDGTSATVYAVIWRRGRVYASVLVVGLAGALDAADAVALAKKQDARVARGLK